MVPHVAGLERYVPRVALEWENRIGAGRWAQVDGSLLFVDISGFTNLSERLAARGRIGAEELTAVLGGVFGRMLDIVHRRGGTMLKFGGDALLLLFEHEDHALQASCSAIEMRAALRTASQEKTTVGRVNLKMSSGIHTGAVDLFLVGSSHRELLITGPAASTTTEMEATAEAGEILVSEATAQRLPGRFIGEPKGGGFLLRSVRTIPPPEESSHAPESQADPIQFISTGLREHLSSGVADSEHRIASIGFVKYKGLDAFLAKRGPEETAAELDRLISAVQEHADRELVTFLATDIDKDGGKVILASGVPTARHDDEGRIVRALRAMVDVPSAFTIQAGVNRGHVFAGNVGGRLRSTYTVMGDTVNLAARLMAAAGPGRLLATRPVLDQATTLFRTEALEPFKVKGKEEPVHAFAVGEEAGVRPPGTERELPFHGRDAELHAILGIVTTCARVGRGGLVTVSGDTGIGKSRLIQEVLEECPEMVVSKVQADPYNSDNPYWALRDPLRLLLDVSGVGREELAETLVRQIEEIDKKLVRMAPLLGDLLHIPIPDNKETSAIDPRFRPERTAETLLALLDKKIDLPFALIVEDEQWMDGSSSDLIRRVAEAAESRPWTVIATTRGEARIHDYGTEIPLRPLSEEAIRSIIVEVMQDSPLLPHQIDAIVSKVGGNPLFLGEILTVVRETGAADQIPDSLDAVVSKQIDTLPPLARQVLRQLAVLGRSFRTDIMHAYLGAAGLAPDKATLESLDGFLESEDQGRTRFRHAVVHDVAYGGLAYRRRREFHALAGSVIEFISADDPEGAAEVLALHFSESGDHAKTWHHARVAGEKAKRTYSNPEAVRHYQRAIEAARHLTVPPEQVAEVWARLGEVQDLMGNYEAARQAFSQAARLVPHAPVRVAGFHLRRAEAWFGSGDLKQAKRSLSAARRAVEGSRKREARAMLARIDAYESSVHAANGDPVAALAAARRAIEGARATGEDEALARAYGSLDWANFMLGNDEPRRGGEAVEIFNRLGQIDRSAMSMGMLGAFAYLEGDWKGAIDWYERSVAAAEASGNAHHAAITRANIAEVLIGQRRPDEAIPLLEEADRFFTASGSDLYKPFIDLQMARAHACRGDVATALPELERLFAAQLDSGDGFPWPETVVSLADALIDTGDAGAALERLDEFQSAMPESAARLGPAVTRLRARAAHLIGDLERARELGVAALESAAGDLLAEFLALEVLVQIADGAGVDPDPAWTNRYTELATRLGVASTADIT